MDTLFVLRTISIVIALAVNTLLVFLVYRNNPTSNTGRIYGLLGAVISLFLVVVYLSLYPSLISHSLALIRLSIFLAVPMTLFFLLLALAMPYDRRLASRPLSIIFVVAIVAMVVAGSPYAFTHVDIVDNTPVPAPGLGFPIFAIVTTAFSLSSVVILIRKLRREKGRERQQLAFVVAGIGGMLGLILATVLVPVALSGSSVGVSFVPLYTLVFLGATAYAIIRHRLFDIRTVIARSVAYLLVVTTFVAAYTLAAFALSYTALGSGDVNPRQQIGYILLALIFAPSIYWLKRTFDKVTNRLFFRDAYNAQDFLNQLNKVLVSTIETEELLERSSALIGQTIKSESCMFVIRPMNGHPQRIIGDSSGKIDEYDVTFLKDHLVHFPGGVVVVDEMTDDHTRLRSFLQEKNIGIVSRLGRSSRKTDNSFGYLIMGVKKSGNAYSQQDVKTIEIVTSELTIATQNALRFEEIEDFNKTLQDKVDEATKKLRKSNERLRLLDQTKDDFISMASHQLRTPLTSVKGYVSMVLDGDGGRINETQRKLLTQSFLSSQRMVYLISDLLNVSRLKTGKFIIEAVESNLAKVVEEELEQLEETIRSRNLELVYNKPEHFPLLMLDETKMRQVVMNFVDNAIYYTPSGGHITVNVVEKPDSVEFTVVDDGIGVPKHEQHHLFGKFFRAHNARSARPDGTGLGLFMAKKVVIAQGGAIIFKSAEGKGSTFGFTFPKARLLPKTAPKAEPAAR